MAQPVNVNLPDGVLLAASAGVLDAFTYLTHGEVFAGLQTGNFILMSLRLGTGAWAQAGHYAGAIMWFLLGVLIAAGLQQHFTTHQAWVLGGWELALIAISSVWPDFTVGLLAMAAATQLQTFRLMQGKAFTSLMMTGNLRTLGDAVYARLSGDRQSPIAKTLAILGGFLIGAAACGFFNPLFGHLTILIATVPLATALVLITKHPSHTE